jgi:hypothetical protein
LREALAAADHDYILTDASRPRRRPKRASAPRPKPRRHGLSSSKTRRLLGFGIGAVCVVALGGIAFNALSLQKIRHPAPLFVHAPQARAANDLVGTDLDAAPTPVPAPGPEPLAPNHEDAPIAKPAAAAASNPHATPVAPDVAPRDAISQLLLGKAPEAEPPQAPALSTKAVLVAQRALVKLGYVLKADGVVGATTRQAIERYERDHHRNSDGELTPAILRRLSDASGEPIN